MTYINLKFELEMLFKSLTLEEFHRLRESSEIFDLCEEVVDVVCLELLINITKNFDDEYHHFEVL